LFALFARDPSKAAESLQLKAAAEHERKSRVSMSMGNAKSAKWHALKVLEYTGHEQPKGLWQLYVSLAWQIVRQLLHRLRFGLWIDRYFWSTDESGQYLTRATFALHQVLSQKRQQTSQPQQLHNILTSLNTMETNLDMHDAVTQARIYLAAAIQISMYCGNVFMSKSMYTRARAMIVNARGCKTSPLNWVLKDQAYTYFVSGQWQTKEIRANTSTVLLPGSIDHFIQSYCQQLLRVSVDSFLKGNDTELVMQQLQELYDCAHANDLHLFLWWSLGIQATVLRRRGEHQSAKDLLMEMDNLVVKQSSYQRTLYYALYAQQCLSEGHHAGCWRALAEASTWMQHTIKSAEPSFPLSDDIATHVTLFAARIILSTRVGLYRVQAYLATSQPSCLITPSADDFESMRQCLATDTAILKYLSTTQPLAGPTALMYQAILRGIFGGRVRPTYQLFTQSIREAERLGLRYDEAVTTLHMCSYLRSHLPVHRLEKSLMKAAATFDKFEVVDDLSSTRKLLKLISLCT
jgi:hypothetical protein